MRINRSQTILVATNCVLIAIVAFGLLSERPLFDRTASAQGSQNSATQRAAMLKELQSMNDRLADVVTSQKEMAKAADKRYRELNKLLKDGQVKVVVTDGHRSR